MIGRYLLGVLGLAAVCGGFGLTGVALRRRFWPALRGAVAGLASTTLALAVGVGAMETLGTLRLFAFVPFVVVAAAVGLGAVRELARAGEGTRPTAARAPRSWRTCLFPALAIAAIAAEYTAPTATSYDIGIRTFDSLWYHLPWAASFAQTHQVTSLRFTDVEYLTAFYPATAEMLHGLGIVLLSRDMLSPLLNVLCLGLALLGGWCIGRPRGRATAAASAVGTALALATPMMAFSQAGSAANDVVGIAFLLGAVALLVSDIFELAAVAAGLAVGTKLSLLAPVALLTLGVLVIDRRRGRWLAWLLAAGGFWYLRNLIAVGNPLPWVSIPGLATPHPALQQHTAFSVAHYLGDSHFVTHTFVAGVHAGLGSWWPVVLLIAVAGPLLCLAGRGSDAMTRMLGAVALGSLAGYVITPESAAGPAGDPAGFAFNLRYSGPALALCLAVGPLAPALRPRRAIEAAAGLLAVVLVATLFQARLWPSGYVPAALVGGLVAGGVAAIALLGPRRPSRRTLLPAALAAATLLAAGGYALQRHYLRGRYQVVRGVSHLSPVWSWFRGVHHARVALVGTFGGFFSYPLYGLDDSNRAEYVARRGPSGSFTSIHTCRGWRLTLNAGHYSLLVATPARDPWHPTRLRSSPEAGWTRGDPAARVVLSIPALGQTIYVFRLSGALDPAGCR